MILKLEFGDNVSESNNGILPNMKTLILTGWVIPLIIIFFISFSTFTFRIVENLLYFILFVFSFFGVGIILKIIIKKFFVEKLFLSIYRKIAKVGILYFLGIFLLLQFSKIGLSQPIIIGIYYWILSISLLFSLTAHEWLNRLTKERENQNIVWIYHFSKNKFYYVFLPPIPFFLIVLSPYLSNFLPSNLLENFIFVNIFLLMYLFLVGMGNLAFKITSLEDRLHYCKISLEKIMNDFKFIMKENDNKQEFLENDLPLFSTVIDMIDEISAEIEIKCFYDIKKAFLAAFYLRGNQINRIKNGLEKCQQEVSNEEINVIEFVKGLGIIIDKTEFSKILTLFETRKRISKLFHENILNILTLILSTLFGIPTIYLLLT